MRRIRGAQAVAWLIVLLALASLPAGAQSPHSVNGNVTLTVNDAVEIRVVPCALPGSEGVYRMSVDGRSVELGTSLLKTATLPIEIRSNCSSWTRIPRSVVLTGLSSSYTFTASVGVSPYGLEPNFQDDNNWYQGFGPVQPRTQVMTATVTLGPRPWTFADLAGDYAGVLTVDISAGTTAPSAWNEGSWTPTP